jgi:hypothetical protein
MAYQRAGRASHRGTDDGTHGRAMVTELVADDRAHTSAGAGTDGSSFNAF